MHWSKTTRNFESVHVDFSFQNGITYLLVIDTRTKWLDIHIMSETTAFQTIEKLSKTFAVIGLPNDLVSDNGPPYTSNEFVKFLQAIGIMLIKSSAYHHISNGIAERSVQEEKC